ncbi:MAG: SCO family protein [Thermoanaerobaculia bacterium]|nr:SCO family protein [Thermoanaerobaculia bacterium]
MKHTLRPAALLLALAAGGPLSAQPMMPSPVREVGWDQKMGAQLPLDATFRDENGKTVRLGDYFGKRPVILSLAYYECPMLCGIALEGLARSLRGFTLSPGADFEVVTLSFSPTEQPPLARDKKTNLLEAYGRREAGEAGWHFLTGDETQIRRVTEAAGFRYRWDELQKEYAHATGIVVATPEGVVSRYFFGVEYAPKELRLGLSEASEGKVGGMTAQLLLLCFQYDPALGKYTATTMTVLRLAGAVLVLGFGIFLALMLRRERRDRAAQLGASA